jgi:hypothetical protein
MEMVHTVSADLIGGLTVSNKTLLRENPLPRKQILTLIFGNCVSKFMRV